MKITIFGGLMLICSFAAIANDPFDRTQRREEKAENVAPFKAINSASNNSPRCHDLAITQAAEQPFSELKLVGIVKFKSGNFVLFTDQENHFYRVQENGLLAQEGYQLAEARTEKIKLARKMGENCAQTETREWGF